MKRNKSAEYAALLAMLRLYCRGRHGRADGLCEDCRELASYSAERLRLCPMDPKPACRDCRAHCYAPALRERVRAVMRYAGPRLPLRRPLLALRHWLGF